MMGLTIEFYSAEPQELVSLFIEELKMPLDDPYLEVIWQKQWAFPRADFSFHLLPDDLEHLCQTIHEHDPSVPVCFEALSVKRLWDDGLDTDSLTLLSDHFACVLAAYSEHDIEQIALAWSSTFRYKEPLSSTPGYQAVLQLWSVARDVMEKGTALIYHLEGSPAFFEYLRYL